VTDSAAFLSDALKQNPQSEGTPKDVEAVMDVTWSDELTSFLAGPLNVCSVADGY